MDHFKLKYLKYKSKYFKLKSQFEQVSGSKKLPRRKKQPSDKPLIPSQVILNRFKSKAIIDVNGEEKEESKKRIHLLRIPSLVTKEDNQIQTCGAEGNNMCIIERGDTSIDGIYMRKNRAKGRFLGLVTNNEGNKIIYVNKNKEISRGSYGEVYKLENLDDELDYYVYKYFKETRYYLIEKIISILIHNLQSSNGNLYNIIPSYWYESVNNKIILMHGRNGDLNKLFDSKIVFNPFDLFFQIIYSVYSLYKTGVYYCDMKLGNILYHVDTKNKVHAILADIGGIVFEPGSEHSNLLSGSDLIGTKFFFYQDEKSEISNYFALYIVIEPFNFKKEIDDETQIGYVKIEDSEIKEQILANSGIDKFTTYEFKNNSNGIQLISSNGSSGNDLDISELNIIFESAVFTYPHVTTEDGTVNIIDKTKDGTLSIIDESNDEIRKLLMNNIFASLGIMFLALIFKEPDNKNNYLYNPFLWRNTNPGLKGYMDTLLKKVENLDKDMDRIIKIKKIISELITYRIVREYEQDAVVRDKFEKIIKLTKELI